MKEESFSHLLRYGAVVNFTRPNRNKHADEHFIRVDTLKVQFFMTLKYLHFP